jgi:hypothetical protein
MKGKYLNLENNLTYTANGNVSNKLIMGKNFEVVECERSDNLKFLVPTNKLKNKEIYSKIK